MLAAGAGCAPSLVYRSALDSGPPPETTIVVEQSFDDTWSALMDLLTTSFADIELLERNSGFIRTDFAGDAASYADCGQIENAPNPWRGDGTYSGPYATWLNVNGGFKARINIVAKELDPQRTQVRVHAQLCAGLTCV